MPRAQEYQIAPQVFEKILQDIIEAVPLTTRNQAYTTLQAVLTVFRRRLNAPEILELVQAFPPYIRAIVTSDWRASEHESGFPSLEELDEQVREYRQHHNFTPVGATPTIVKILKAYADETKLNAFLERQSQAVREFWNVT